MQHMRNSAIILAALLTATPTLATDQCVEVEIKHMAVGEPTYAKYADTAHCFLQIDGKIIIDRMCNISSPKTCANGAWTKWPRSR